MSDTLSDEFGRLLRDWGEAIVSNDAAAIARFATDAWVLVDPRGGPIESDRFFEAVASGALTHDSFEVDAKRVDDLRDVAMVVAHVLNGGRYLGAPFSADEWATDVFVRRHGGWLCALTALTPRLPAE